MKKILFIIAFILASIGGYAQVSAAQYAITLDRLKVPTFGTYVLAFYAGDSATAPITAYIYDTTSVATPDGINVIIPNSNPTKGRWIKWDFDINSIGAATYSGTTNGSGVYSVTYGTAYASTPKVVAQIRGGSIGQNCVLTSSTTSGFSVSAYEYDQTSILGITVFEVTTTPVTGATIDVLVFEQ